MRQFAFASTHSKIMALLSFENYYIGMAKCILYAF